jgi:hypothetical protein
MGDWFVLLYPSTRSIVGAPPLRGRLVTDPGEKILRVGRQERDAARRRDQRHRHSQIVHFVSRLEIDSRSPEVLVNNRAERWRCVGNAEKCLPNYVLHTDRFERRQP